MTITFASETTSLPDRIFSALADLGRGLSALRVRRAQRLALASLLELDSARLDDLGINTQDVAEAIRSRGETRRTAGVVTRRGDGPY
jgi:uncharacterized protein YjiS (DUF1127 family)